MKKVVRLLTMGVVLIMGLGVFAGCGGKAMPYNAVMYGEIYTNRTWLQDEFYEANLTSGSWSSLEGEYVSGELYPLTRTKIITDSVEYAEVFKDFPVEVNFENTMIVIHCFTTSSSGKYEIKDISVDEQTLIVRYKHPVSKGKNTPNASQPLTKWVIVVMDKMDIETAEFIFGN
ncbi:MAG: hypothetical protein FWH03_03290 [Firmicutes bacterium]|nr:hypothetical protein [Bacillota bacterium]